MAHYASWFHWDICTLTVDFWPGIWQMGKLRPRMVPLLVLSHAVSQWQTQSQKEGICASQFHSQTTFPCPAQGEWYITSKPGKDAPSALVLEGLAASLIHSLQLHCWKRVQKEDQATRKQPQYLIWLDLAGRLLRLYICSFLTKGTGVSFFSSLYLFYGSPVNFSLYYQNWREALPDGDLEALPTSDWTQKPPCHMSLIRVSWHVHIGEKNKQGEEKVMLSAATIHLYLIPCKLLQKVIIWFLISCPVTCLLHNIFT